MFNTVISFGNDISVPEEVLEKTVEDILQTIKSELPEEAQTYEVYESILCRCKDRLHCVIASFLPYPGAYKR